MKKSVIPSKPVFEIKGVHCSDIVDFDAVENDPLESFNMPFSFSIGTVGSDTADNYEILVCSPDRVDEVRRTETHFIVLPILLPKVAITCVKQLVEHANSRDDPQSFIAAKLAWEFDGYR